MSIKYLYNSLRMLTFITALSITSMTSFPLHSVSQSLVQLPDFTNIAADTIPAVASIKVKAIPTTQRVTINPWGMQNDEGNDFFGNDFFRQFFSFPQGREESTPIEGQASGFLVSKDGHLLTNSHVIKGANEINVTLNDGREFTAQVIGQDPNTDIALIKIEGSDLPYLKLGNSNSIKPGQWAIAIGNPLGLQATVTVGVISATGRNNLDITRIEDFIQTDAPINRGNSGGPLLNTAGEVIGMNTAIVTNMGTGGYMGIGFAIPSNMLKKVMDELQASGKVTRGFLGINMQQIDSSLAKAFNLNKAEGALVAEVSKESPAESAGIKQGDVILKYNDQTVQNIAALRNAVAMMEPGTKISLTVMRDGKTLTIPITIGTFPQDSEFAATEEVKEGINNRFGFTIQNLTPDVAKALGLQEDKGVIISKVKPGSPASWAGLKKGALIVSVNQKKIENVQEFNRSLESIQKGSPLLLLIKQDGSVRYVSLLVNQ